MVIDYSKGKIYCLKCNTTGKKYFGSTTQTLEQRLQRHVDAYKHKLRHPLKKYTTTSSQIIENMNYEISLKEDGNFISKVAMLVRERFYIENNDCINKMIPYRTEEEKPILQTIHNMKYYIENKVRLVARHKIYREKNKDKLKASTECECGGRYQHNHKSNHFKSMRHQKYIENLK